jgi:hypothetical protein
LIHKGNGELIHHFLRLKLLQQCGPTLKSGLI